MFPSKDPILQVLPGGNFEGNFTVVNKYLCPTLGVGWGGAKKAFGNFSQNACDCTPL